MLASTEATVRGQAEKMKQYRAQLEEAGLLPKSPVRSRSESNLSTAGQRAFMKPGGSAGDVNASTLPGVNLDKLRGYGRSDIVQELRGEIKELQNSVMQYDNAVVSLKSQIRGNTNSDDARDLTKRSQGSHIPILTSRLRTISGSSVSGSVSTMAIPSSAGEQQVQSLKQEVEELTSYLVSSKDTNATLAKELEEAVQKVTVLETEARDFNRPGPHDPMSMSQKLQKIEKVEIVFY
jgi:hypothetical protein